MLRWSLVHTHARVYGPRVRTKGIITRSSQKRLNKFSINIVRTPGETNNNIGSTKHKIKSIRKKCTKVFLYSNEIRCWCVQKKNRTLFNIISIRVYKIIGEISKSAVMRTRGILDFDFRSDRQLKWPSLLR